MSNNKPTDHPTTHLPGSSAKPQLTSPLKRPSAKRKPRICAENKHLFNKIAIQTSHIINPVCKGIFKKYKHFETNKLLLFPGAEIQLVYQCAYPHIGKLALNKAAEHFRQELLASEELKKNYSDIHIVYVPLRRYVQVIITIVNDDLYTKLYD